jgi:hypothetical protein
LSADTEAQIDRAREVMARISGGRLDDAPAPRGPSGGMKRLKRIAAANAAILLAAVVYGAAVAPLGILGVMLVVLLVFAATAALAVWPQERAPKAEALRVADVKVLPAQTGRWLATQRATLPAPAARVADRIGRRLDVLSPQLAGVPSDGPEAAELRKLVGEQLPALVSDYGRVPVPLRTQARNGRTPDAELTDGLSLIEQELGELSERLAAGDLDQLQTRGRYLELKYKNDEA